MAYDSIAALRTPVLVLNFNGWKDTAACLDELTSRLAPESVWLIDNGSDDDRCAEFAAARPGLNTLALPRNLGWAGGYNRALRHVFEQGAEFAFLLNNDAKPCAGFLEPLLQAMASDDRLAAVGCLILEGDGETVWFDGEYGAKARPESAELRPAAEVNGAAMLMRRAAFEDVGEFDERFFLYHEEADWCRRAAARGWRFAVAPKAEVVHTREASDQNANSVYYRLRNLFLCCDKGLPDRPGEDRTALFIRLLETAKGLEGQAREAAFQALADGLARRYGQRGKGPGLPALALIPARLAALPRRLRRKFS